jgi:hypothetical protein
MRSLRKLWMVSVILLVMAMVTTASAQTLPPDRPGLESGRAGWMEVLPETYGYFGPDFVLAHRDSIGLAPGQLRSVRDIYDRVHMSALNKGKEILNAEEDLEDLFSTGKVTQESAMKQAELIGKLRGELRALYLNAGISLREILNDRQRAILTRIRNAAPPLPPEIR